MRLLGGHPLDVGGIDMAVRRAGRAGMRALQINTASPQYYSDRASIRPERIERFRAALAGTEIDPRHVMAHAAFVLNMATPDDAKWVRSRAGLTKELERSTALGIGAVCFHPGSAGDGDRTESLERIGRAIVSALENITGDTRLLIENTAGAGRTMGRTAEEIAGMLSHVPGALRRRTGYGLDTCHLFASGYDVTTSAPALSDILDTFERVIGEPPAFFHLNDSEGALGSNRDRHALIGAGAIGTEPFRWLLNDARSAGIPLILETPQENAAVAEEDDTPDPFDARMIALLRSLAPDP